MPRKPHPAGSADRKREITQSTLRRSLATNAAARASQELVALHDQRSESPTLEARALAAVLRWHSAEVGTWEHARACIELCEIADEAERTR